jgi:hypothetical protein
VELTCAIDTSSPLKVSLLDNHEESVDDSLKALALPGVAIVD